MVNDTLGGRRLGLPYCTLCVSMQAYYTDGLPSGVEPLTLRTSGLLIRSNTVMCDRNTHSVFDTFLGNTVSGPLHERGVQLKRASVVTTTWGAWNRDHPETTVRQERYALGRDPDFRSGRDANGPILPGGSVDPRLPVQADIVGVITASGTAVAFPKTEVLRALRRNEPVVFENAHLRLDGSGLRAVDESGQDQGSHEAFWFAWSQFDLGTQMWTRSRR
jgi:hypothetical protein